MKRRNPEWDGVATPTIADGQVVGITFDSLNLKDLSSIMAFTVYFDLLLQRLQVLEAMGSSRQ
jgi:hypothetical protein